MTDYHKISINTFNKHAAGYQDKFMDVSLYGESLDLFCKLLNKPDAAIFEIGCGPGNVTRYLLSALPHAKIKAIDMAPNMIRLAEENNPQAEFMLMDAREINTVSETFEGVMCGFCMPYLSKEECMTLIKDAAALLKNNGIFYFSTMEGDYEKSGYEYSSNGEDKAFIHYHEEEYLRKGLTGGGFEIADVSRKKYAKADGTPVTDLIMIAKKKAW